MSKGFWCLTLDLDRVPPSESILYKTVSQRFANVESYGVIRREPYPRSALTREGCAEARGGEGRVY